MGLLSFAATFVQKRWRGWLGRVHFVKVQRYVSACTLQYWIRGVKARRTLRALRKVVRREAHVRVVAMNVIGYNIMRYILKQRWMKISTAKAIADLDKVKKREEDEAAREKVRLEEEEKQRQKEKKEKEKEEKEKKRVEEDKDKDKKEKDKDKDKDKKEGEGEDGGEGGGEDKDKDKKKKPKKKKSMCTIM